MQWHAGLGHSSNQAGTILFQPSPTKRHRITGDVRKTDYFTQSQLCLKQVYSYEYDLYNIQHFYYRLTVTGVSSGHTTKVLCIDNYIDNYWLYH